MLVIMLIASPKMIVSSACPFPSRKLCITRSVHDTDSVERRMLLIITVMEGT